MLKCQTHNKYIANVSSDMDFKTLTGCKLKCNTKLLCGHICDKLCHIEDSGHSKSKCQFACKKYEFIYNDSLQLLCTIIDVLFRKCIRNHKCCKMCYEECGTCENFTSEFGVCGHNIQGKCCDIENTKCQMKVCFICFYSYLRNYIILISTITFYR